MRVQQTIRKFDLIKPGEHVLVAVSGGPDSTALLLCLQHLAAGLGIKLSVAHLNHRVRGEEADADLEFVRELTTELNLPFVSDSVELLKSEDSLKKNFEERAREARYEFLRRMASRTRADKVALGHNLNDQAETVPMRLIRGSGPEGLSAIHPCVAKLFIRPLLECRRREILEYLRALGCSYREDSTNKDLRYQRNRVRHELIPYLQERFNPGVLEVLARHAEMMRELFHYLQTQAKKFLEESRTAVPGGISLPVEKLLRLDPMLQKTVLRYAVKECRGSLRGIALRHVDDMLSLCLTGHSGRRIQLPGKSLAVRQFDHLLILDAERTRAAKYSYPLALPGERNVPEAGISFLAQVTPRKDLPNHLISTANRVFLDARLIPETLTIRSRLPGDRYGGSRCRKVKKMLIDARIPLQSRSALPMVAAGDIVVWIPGFRPAKSFTVQPQSDRCVVLEVKPGLS